MVNRFTKMTRYIPIRNTIDAAMPANVLVYKLILRGAGVPSSIVHQANPTKLSQATLERVLWEAAEKEARKKVRAEAARQAQEARKTKAEEALASRPKRRSERLQSRIGSESQ
jgi:hypothetical protein